MRTPADIITRLQLISQDGTKSDRKLAGFVLAAAALTGLQTAGVGGRASLLSA